VTLASLVSRIGKDARRLKAAVDAKLSPPLERPRQPLSRTGIFSSAAEALYPGLPGPGLKAAVEASLERVALSEHSLTRFSMYESLADRLAARDGLKKTCLAISGSSRLARVLGLRAARIVEASYPEHSMLALGFADATFDFCVSDQVLEHVEGNPFDAVRESFRIVAPGGFVVHASCLLNPIHREPGDFWRFTPDALALLCRSAGGTVLEAAAWGNRNALALTAVGIRMHKVPADPDHPLHRIAVANDPAWPIHTWVVAQKRG
jgi:SAM-dependent methyltransferase